MYYPHSVDKHNNINCIVRYVLSVSREQSVEFIYSDCEFTKSIKTEIG